MARDIIFVKAAYTFGLWKFESWFDWKVLCMYYCAPLIDFPTNVALFRNLCIQRIIDIETVLIVWFIVCVKFYTYI